MIVLDASVLIAHLGATDALHDRAVELLVATADDSLGISPLSLAEVFVGPARTGKLATAQRAIADLDIATISLTDDAPQRLAALRSATGLRLPDCCVVFAAQTAGAAIATFDDQLANAARGIGLAVLG